MSTKLGERGRSNVDHRSEILESRCYERATSEYRSQFMSTFPDAYLEQKCRHIGITWSQTYLQHIHFTTRLHILSKMFFFVDSTSYNGVPDINAL